MLLPALLLPDGMLSTSQAIRGCWRQVLLKTMSNSAQRSESVWHALSDDLRAFLRKRVDSDADADDLLQNVFLRVVEKISSLRQADRIESWVYQIARNEIADFYRRRTPKSAEAVEDVVDPNQVNSVSNRNRTVGGWLALMIGQLPNTLRDAVRMYEIDGLSQAEIARRLSISLSGAKSRVQRGRRRLEQLLRGCCQLELDRRGNILECKSASGSGVSCECNGQGL